MKIKIIFLLLFISKLLFSQDGTLVYKNTVNSTVTIQTENGLGSGFFVAPNIIATNYHVMKNAGDAYCFLSNSTTMYKIDGYLAVDKSVDLVLLQVSELNRPALKFSTLNVNIGQKLFVIGSPKGLPATISDGIVSALREFEGKNLIQMTAPISPGSSGGPVMNSNGELVGISVSQFREGQNLNFAIPKSYLETLLLNRSSNPKSLLDFSYREMPLLGHWITESRNTHYYISSNYIIMVDEGENKLLSYNIIQSSNDKMYYKIAVTLLSTGRGHEKVLKLASDKNSLIQTTCEGDYCLDTKWIYIDERQEP